MRHDDYARVKALFNAVCDLVEPALTQRLDASGADAPTIAKVRVMLAREHATTRHFERPIVSLLGEIGSDECAPGDVLGAWTLDERIGHGGMGSVYRAHRSDGHFQQNAAIKVLRGLPSNAALAYLARERQILATLSHPNIARLIDGGATPKGQPFLVMDFVDGMPIDDYVREHPLPLAAVLRLLEAVCAAVGFAHQRLIVHCDLKPGNILVTRDGRPMLLDFGIARLIGGDGDDGDAATRAFTPGYASPEQREGGVVSTATDIYSLGLMLVELVNGTPEEGAPPLDPKQLADPELRAIALKAAADDPARRYLSADALAQDIARYLDRQPVQAMASSAGYRLRKFVQRRRPWVLTGLLFLITVSAFTLRVVADRDRAEAAERSAVQERDRAVQAQASSKQISEFLVSILNGSHPDAGSGEIPTSKLVAQALTRIDTELAGQPAAQAELYATLAGVQHVLGNDEAARQHYDQALTLQRTLGQPLALARQLASRAWFIRAVGSKDDALADARESFALIQANAPPESNERTDAMQLLGILLSETGKLDEAEPVLLDALRRNLAADARGEATIQALEALGSHFEHREDYAKSAGYYERELALRREHDGPRSRPYFDTMEVLGMAYSHLGRVDEAETHLRESLAGFHAIDGDDSAEMAWRLSQLARVLDNSGRSLDALPLYRQALTIGAKKMGVGSVSYAVLLNNLAIAHRRSGDFSAAARAYAQAIPIMRKAWKETDPTVSRVLTDYGTVLLATADLDQAHTLLQTAYAARVAAGGESTADAIVSASALAEWEVLTRHADAALRRLQALATPAAALRGLDRATYLRALGLAQGGAGDAGAALVSLRESEALVREKFGERDPRTWLAQLDRADVLAGQGGAAAEQAAVLKKDILSKVDKDLVASSPLRTRLR